MIFLFKNFFLLLFILFLEKNINFTYASPFGFDNGTLIKNNPMSITEGKAFEKEEDIELSNLIENFNTKYFVSTITLSTGISVMIDLPVKVISSRQIIKDPENNFRQYIIEGKENLKCTHPSCKNNPKYKKNRNHPYQISHVIKEKSLCSNLTAMNFYPEYYVLEEFQLVSYPLMRGLFKIIDIQESEPMLILLNKCPPLKIFPYVDQELLKIFDLLYPNVTEKEDFYYDIKNNRLFLFHFKRNFNEVSKFIQNTFQKNLLNCLRPNLFYHEQFYYSYNFSEDFLACMNLFNDSYESSNQDDHSHPNYKIRQILNEILKHLPLCDTNDDMIDYQIYHTTLFIIFFKAIASANEKNFKYPQQFLQVMQKIAFLIKEDELNISNFSFFINDFCPYKITPYFRSIGGLMCDYIKPETYINDIIDLS